MKYVVLKFRLGNVAMKLEYRGAEMAVIFTKISPTENKILVTL